MASTERSFVAKPKSMENSHDERAISREELSARLEDRALVVLNVMPKEAYTDGHIPGSINLPVAEIEAKARALISNFAQEIAVYCAGPT